MDIVVLGSLITDFVVQLPTLPTPGQTVIGDTLRMIPGGKGGNQAIAAARLGATVAMSGRVGEDDLGSELITRLRADGIDVSRVDREPGTATGAALIMVDERGENMIAVAPGANLKIGEADVDRALDAVGDGVLVMQMEMSSATADYALVRAHERGVRVILNAAPARPMAPALFQGLDVLVVNETEAQTLTGEPVHSVANAQHAASHLLEWGVQLAIVTLGAQGSVVCDASRSQWVQPFTVAAVDSTAAGDAFIGALAVALSADVPVLDATRLANAAGATAVTMFGAMPSLPRPEDIERVCGVQWPVGVA